jgi:hypothetical protein
MALVMFGSTTVASGQQSAPVPAPEPAPPRPWDGQMAPRLYALGTLGMFGDARAQSATMRTGAPVSPSAGAAIGAELPLGHAFSLGVEGSFWAWSASRAGQMDVAQSMLLEISAVPRFRCPWGTPTGEHFSLGLAIPIGPSLSWLHNEDGSNMLAALGARDGIGSGMHVGALIELQAFVLPQFGFVFDVGYLHHFLWHRSAITGDRDVHVDFGQAVARFGVILAL